MSPFGTYPMVLAERATVPDDGGRSPDMASSSAPFPDPLPPMIADELAMTDSQRYIPQSNGA